MRKIVMDQRTGNDADQADGCSWNDPVSTKIKLKIYLCNFYDPEDTHKKEWIKETVGCVGVLFQFNKLKIDTLYWQKLVYLVYKR